MRKRNLCLLTCFLVPVTRQRKSQSLEGSAFACQQVKETFQDLATFVCWWGVCDVNKHNTQHWHKKKLFFSLQMRSDKSYSGTVEISPEWDFHFWVHFAHLDLFAWSLVTWFPAPLPEGIKVTLHSTMMCPSSGMAVFFTISTLKMKPFFKANFWWSCSKASFSTRKYQNSFLPQASTTNLLDDVRLDKVVW